ncbi:MAG: nucleoside deaminase [Microthrixaceae bacterium]
MIDRHVGADPPRYMRLALATAQASGEAGDLPIGAVAVIDGNVIATAGNRRELDGDPTAHAEVLLLRAAASHVGDWRLDKVTVVVTLEPCPMCAGALWASRVGGVVFGATDPKAGSNGSLYHLGADPRLNHEYETLGGVLADECGALLTSYFAERRSRARDDPPRR